jgi:IMP dehydrogenase/GMP reductase
MPNFPKIQQALSFDDVLLLPQYSEIQSRRICDLTTSLTEKVKIGLPIVIEISG